MTVVLSVLELPLFVTPQLSAVFHASWCWSWVWASLPRSLPFYPLSSIPRPIAPFLFMRVAEPSCLRRCLKCSGWALSSRPLGYCCLWISSSYIAAFPVVAGPCSNTGLVFMKGCPRRDEITQFLKTNPTPVVLIDPFPSQQQLIYHMSN